MIGIDDALELGGSLVGQLFGQGQDDKSRQAYMDALSRLQDTNAQAPGTAYDSIKLDPATRAAEMSSLQGLQSEANQGGLTTNDRVAQQEAQDRAAQAERGSRGALLEQMQARGMRGSGSELAAALQNQQGSATRNAATGATTAASARTRALQSLQSAGQLGGQVRGQDWQQASTRAQAQDAINRFNAGQRLQQSGMVAGGYGQVAGQAQRQGQQQRDFWTGLGTGAGGLYDELAKKNSPSGGGGGYANTGEWV